MASKPARPLTNSLRVLIAAGSIGAFLGGWALLANSPNPYENAQAAPLDEPFTDPQNNNARLAPLPTPRAHTAPNMPQIQPRQSQQNVQPQQQFGAQSTQPFRVQRRMRTGGS